MKKPGNQHTAKKVASSSFKEAYDTLSRAANTLETMQEPDLDRVVKLMSEAAQAYDACQTRIRAVESILKERGWLANNDEASVPR